MSEKRCPMFAGSILIAWNLSKTPPAAKKRCLAMYGPKTPAIKAPPIIIAKCDTSCEVITLPLSRASWSFLGVASSVFCD